MRKGYFFALVILSIFCFSLKVDAAECKGNTLSSLQKEAGNVKVNHEIVKETITKHLYDYFDNELPETVEFEKTTIKINLYNLTKNIFVVQTEKNYSTYDNEMVLYGESRTPLKFDNEKTIDYKDSNNGNYTWNLDNLDHYIDYKFEIYSNTSSCDTTLLRTITYRKPKYNKFAKDPVCTEYPSVKLCNEFISEDINLSGKIFADEVKRIGESGNKQEDVMPEETTEIKKGNNKEKIYIALSGTVVILIIIGYLVIDKRRSRI